MDDMFRYMSIRSPRRQQSATAVVAIDVSPSERSAFHQGLVDLRSRGAPRHELVNAAISYQSTREYERPLVGAFAGIDDVARRAGSGDLGAQDMLAAGAAALAPADEAGGPGASAAVRLRVVLHSADGRETWRRLVDAVLSLQFARRETDLVPDELVSRIKIIHLLHAALDGRWPFAASRPLATLLELLVPVVPAGLFERSRAAPRPGLDVARQDHGQAPGLQAQVARLAAAAAELSMPRLQLRLGLPVAPDIAEPRPPIRPSMRGWRWGARVEEPVLAVGPGIRPGIHAAPKLLLAPAAFDDLTHETRETLGGLGFTRDGTDLVEAQLAVDRELVHAHTQAGSHRRFAVLVGGLQIALPPFTTMPPGAGRPTIDPAFLLPLVSEHYAGQGELRVVRQELVAYELGDIAHVENVLAGEERERRHRRLDRTEELERQIAEETRESERDLQSTERHELEAEAQREAAQAGRVEGGLQVSGSYGPTVTFTANANAGFSFETRTSERRANRFAREVVERAVERIRTRELTERRIIRIREVEERNLHAIRNAAQGAAHVRGVYRWLNKIYRAQIYAYGLRHMFEFMVPEPAAYYLWSLAQPTASPVPVPFLERPGFGPEDITRASWQRLAAQYGAQVVSPPPPMLTFVAFTKDEKQPGNHTFGDKLRVPEGYEAFAAYCAFNCSTARGDPADGAWWLSIHDRETGGPAQPYLGTIPCIVEHGEIPIGYRDWGLSTYVLTVNVACICTAAHLKKWQYDTYTAIMDAYRAYEADMQARAAQAEIGRGIHIPGRNPIENRRVIADELQRACLSIMTGSPLDGFDAFAPTPSGEALNWRMETQGAVRLGREVRFFQHAFEWENMTYLFYPYFWGRSGSRWIQVLHQYADPDPLFAAFLKSGMARVQLPVRPGFEQAVARYAQDGTLWGGNDAPMIGDSLHVPIIDEIKRQLEAPDEGVPIGTPWEVRVPTDLVLLEDAANLQGFRDPLFGRNGLSAIVFAP